MSTTKNSATEGQAKPVSSPIASIVEGLREAGEREALSSAGRLKVIGAVCRAITPAKKLGGKDHRIDMAYADYRAGLRGLDLYRKHVPEIQKCIDEVHALARVRAQFHRVDSVLSELEAEKEIVFEGFSDQLNFSSKITRMIQPMLVEEICGNPGMSDAQIRKRIEELVYEHYEELCN